MSKVLFWKRPLVKEFKGHKAKCVCWTKIIILSLLLKLMFKKYKVLWNSVTKMFSKRIDQNGYRIFILFKPHYYFLHFDFFWYLITWGQSFETLYHFEENLWISWCKKWLFMGKNVFFNWQNTFVWRGGDDFPPWKIHPNTPPLRSATEYWLALMRSDQLCTM